MRILSLIFGFLITVTSVSLTKAVFIKVEGDEKRIITVSFRTTMGEHERDDENYESIPINDLSKTIVHKTDLLFQKNVTSINYCFKDISSQNHLNHLRKYIESLLDIENPRDDDYKFITMSADFIYNNNLTAQDTKDSENLLKSFMKKQKEKAKEAQVALKKRKEERAQTNMYDAKNNGYMVK